VKRLVGDNLCFRYGRRAVLRAGRVEVVPRRVRALLGPTGSGKTTLLWLLAGVLKPHEGRVVLAGDDGAEPAELRRGELGMVFQHAGLWEHLTVEAHLKLVLAGAGLARAERRRCIEDILRRTRLAELRRRRPGQLSGGERQRLSLARALVVRPGWLLLDEPLAHLDGAARQEVFDLLRTALADTQAGVLLATHNAAEALRIADDVLILLEGRLVQSGPTEQVYREPVNLAVARVLGDAGELRGRVERGTLYADGAAILDGLDGELTGEQALILRPEDVTFEADGDGPARVRRCELTPGGWRLTVAVAGMELPVFSRRPVAPETPGRLHVAR
jgi:ABC-type sulfate/molybdate transport systems ATPase subunit